MFSYHFFYRSVRNVFYVYISSRGKLEVRKLLSCVPKLHHRLCSKSVWSSHRFFENRERYTNRMLQSSNFARELTTFLMFLNALSFIFAPFASNRWSFCAHRYSITRYNDNRTELVRNCACVRLQMFSVYSFSLDYSKCSLIFSRNGGVRGETISGHDPGVGTNGEAQALW